MEGGVHRQAVTHLMRCASIRFLASSHGMDAAGFCSKSAKRASTFLCVSHGIVLIEPTLAVQLGELHMNLKTFVRSKPWKFGKDFSLAHAWILTQPRRGARTKNKRAAIEAARITLYYA